MKFAKLALIFLLPFVFSGPALAQEISIPTQSISPAASPTPSFDYDLPYPGILPGNPLYSIKAMRDKFTEFLISSPDKKAKFELLQADKRLAASIDLFDQGKDSLGESTLSKSQNYLESSLNQIVIAKKSNKFVGDISSKAKSSSEKQTEIIGGLVKTKNGEIKIKLEYDLKRAQDLQKKAEELSP